MTDFCVLGLPLHLGEGDADDIMSPLAAVTVLKYLDSEGTVSYMVRGTTEGVSTVEAIGMVRYALVKLEEQL